MRLWPRLPRRRRPTPTPTLVEDWGDSVPLLGAPLADGLDDVFGHLLDGLLRITEGSSESDQVEVMDL